MDPELDFSDPYRYKFKFIPHNQPHSVSYGKHCILLTGFMKKDSLVQTRCSA